MKPQLTFLLIFTLCYTLLNSGCTESTPKPSNQVENKPSIVHLELGKDCDIYIIDSCEYVGQRKGFNDDILTHKGNCKFCAERNKYLILYGNMFRDYINQQEENKRH